MTFKQLGKDDRTYVNKFGIVFIPLVATGDIRVACNIDSDTSLELIKPVRELSSLFISPEKVDYVGLYQHVFV